MVGRATPNSSISLASEGTISPSPRRPRRIRGLIFPPTISGALGTYSLLRPTTFASVISLPTTSAASFIRPTPLETHLVAPQSCRRTPSHQTMQGETQAHRKEGKTPSLGL